MSHSLADTITEVKSHIQRGAYTNEENVRLSLIARICQELGWDIWNPDEFFTEYPIKLPKKQGSVDVALFHTRFHDRTPDVFIEAKAMGKLEGQIIASEEQLQEYNYYNSAAITILTDGRQWRFYLSSAPGTFKQRLFCKFDLLEDETAYIAELLQRILAKERFHKDAINVAQSMLSDLKKAQEIDRAKQKAKDIADEYPELNLYQRVQKVLAERGHKLDLDEIKRLWSPTVSVVEPEDEEPKVKKAKSGRKPSKSKYAFKSPKRVFVIDKWFEVKTWRDVKVAVLNYIFEKNPDLDLKVKVHDKKNIVDRSPEGYYNPGQLNNGYYTSLNLSADDAIRHSNKALASIGENPIQIEYPNTED